MNKENVLIYLRKFFKSLLLPLSLSIVTIISWKINSLFLILFFNSIISIGIVKFKANSLNIILIIFSMIAGFRYGDYNYTSCTSILGFISIAVGMCFLLFNFIKNIKQYNYKHMIIYTFLSFILSAILSLINVSSDTLSMTLISIGKFILVFILMLYVFTQSEYTEDNKKYLSFIMIFISCVILVQMFLVYFEVFDPNDPFDVIVLKKLHLGWAMGNRYVSFICISLIISFYLYIDDHELKNKVIVGLFIILQGIAVLVCLTRGAMLGLAVGLVPMIVIVFFYSKNKKIELYSLGILVSFALISLVLLYQIDVFESLFNKILNLDFSDGNGRTPLYELAFDQFKQDWLFGNGSNTSKYFINTIINREEHNYHNIILQTMAEQGIVGLITMCSFFGAIGLTCLKKDLFKSIVLCVTIYMLAHGMVDTTFHSHNILPIYICLIGFIMIKGEGNDGKEICNTN